MGGRYVRITFNRCMTFADDRQICKLPAGVSLNSAQFCCLRRQNTLLVKISAVCKCHTVYDVTMIRFIGHNLHKKEPPAVLSTEIAVFSYSKLFPLYKENLSLLYLQVFHFLCVRLTCFRHL